MGVEMDPLDPTSVAGLTYSGALTSMLPSEAVLLRSQRRTLRWLFLAKKAESKLLCVFDWRLLLPAHHRPNDQH